MFFLQDRFIFSASDLSIAVTCEYQSLSLLDIKMGRRQAPDFGTDEMLNRAAELGDVHEQRVLQDLIAQFGDYEPATGRGVIQFTERPQMTHEALEAANKRTIEALQGNADVIFQATFYDGSFIGFADFLVHQADGAWAVWDTKLARHPRVSALLQLGAYAEQMQSAGIKVDPHSTLILGDGTQSTHRITEILPVYRAQRNKFLALTTSHRRSPEPVTWDSENIKVCGRCDYCAEQVVATNDVLQVANMSMVQRSKLRQRGIQTIHQLAELVAPEGTSLARHAEQARMQMGLSQVDGSVHGVSYKIKQSSQTISRLPQPDAGDIFFDFEGDPMYQDPTDDSWGLEYLFGVVEHDSGSPVFKPFWAHNRAEERVAFMDFIQYVNERRDRFPNMRIYHYAPYEKTALRNLSQTHVTGEEAIDNWLREGLLVDLYETVRNSLVLSTRSYSIKKLEPLYMGDHLRSGDVTDAGASVVAYAHYMRAVESAQNELAKQILSSIADYNEYDCLSTLRLRDWLLSLVPQQPHASQDSLQEPELPDLVVEPTAEEIRLQQYIAGLPAGHPLSADDRAISMVAAATGYHRRERKQFWWEHFDRLAAPVEDWSESRGVFIVDHIEPLSDWEAPTARSRTMVRSSKFYGTLAEGSLVSAGTKFFSMFEGLLPDGVDAEQTVRGGLFNATVTAVEEDHLVIQEKSTTKVQPYGSVPMALTPDQPIRTASIEDALAGIANQVGAMVPSLPQTAGIDILRRIPPRFKTFQAPPIPELVDGAAQVYPAVVKALLDLDNSYLAVQGPPGTGKTYVASHVITALVKHGWKIGVVAQSHAVVENVLTKSVEAGVPADLVAKKVNHDRPVNWLGTGPNAVAELLARDEGCLVGGTAWTLTGKHVPPGSLDLLVIDEAGQYSLANTLAVSVATRNLLLLGDPQQLPQVTQGSHPQPVDESALGWLSAGHPILPAELGYFLAASWRMHPQLCAKVSELSYDGQLFSAPAAGERQLSGPAAGVETRLLDHSGNTTSSREEAEQIVTLVTEHLGLKWTPDPAQPARTLDASDILVVAAYNAQVQLLREVLDQHHYQDVRVGTVDKFQGQEAPVVLMSMACSSAEDAARGIDFLLNRNRVNVAISRGQWRAVIVRSPRLTDFLPGSISGLTQLGAFLSL